MITKPSDKEIRSKRELAKSNPDYLLEHITSPTEINWILEQIQADIQQKKVTLARICWGHRQAKNENVEEQIQAEKNFYERSEIGPLKDEELRYIRHKFNIKYPKTVDESISKNEILDSIDSTGTQRIKLLDEIGLIDTIKSKLKNPESTTDLINVLNFLGITNITNPKSRSTEYRTLMKLLDESDQLSSTDLTKILELLQLNI